MLEVKWPETDQRKPVEASPMSSALLMSRVRAETEKTKTRQF